jgi:hypothetical protein
LNDVPTLSELLQIAEDGTYKLDAEASGADTDQTARKLAYIYQKGTRDAQGNEIDLRTTPQDLMAVGTGEMIPLVPPAQLREHAPRYDPETGELISELDLNGHADPPVNPAAIPMAKATINYASGNTIARHSLLRIVVNLLSPLNIAVMFGVLCIHVVLWPLSLLLYLGILFFIIAIPFIAGGILAHYGNVIEEIGIFERDELPRPLRDLGWHEDLWRPFSSVLGSLIICYGPAIVLPILSHRISALDAIGSGLAMVCGVIGAFFLPAVVLTLQCGGTILNLRPDRVFTTIISCGKDYLVATGLWVFASFLYLWGWMGTTLAMVNAVHTLALPASLTSWTVVLPALCAGIFAMHVFCVEIGMLYRLHHEGFPWVLQKHVPTKKDPKQIVPSRPSGPRPAPARQLRRN